MKDIGQQYQLLLSEEIDILESERRKDYESLFDDLARQRMVRADIHIEQALELERKYIQCFFKNAIAQYKKFKNPHESDLKILEKMYRHEINSFFGRSLQRMLGIVSNVRGSITDAFVLNFLEKVKSEAFKAFESAKKVH
jgi:uncharacterized protein with gpF-like domain